MREGDVEQDQEHHHADAVVEQRLAGHLHPQAPRGVYLAQNPKYGDRVGGRDESAEQQAVEQGDVQTCGMELIRQFLTDPVAPIDTECTDRVLPLVFEGNPTISSLLLGTVDAWDDSSGTSSQAWSTNGQGATDEAARAWLERLRARAPRRRALLSTGRR